MEVVAGDSTPEATGGTRLVVPPTPSGVAAALTRLNATREVGPHRADPTRDVYLPSIRLDEDADLDEVRRATPDTEVELYLPPRLDALFVAAPLAHYLGAAVEVELGTTPRLAVPDREVRYDLPSLPHFQDAVADLLARCVGLDRLACNADRRGSAIETTGIDPERISRASPGERVESYLDVPPEAIDSEEAGWDLAMYVEPDREHVPVLSHLLERPCAIYLPEATAVEREELIRRSLEDFYRSRRHPDLDVDLVSLGRRRGRVRGWLADGVAVDAFKATPSAYENRAARRDRAGQGRIAVVVNDPEMETESVAIDRIYRGFGDALEVSIEHGLTRAELAATFERPASFVHYVGHCDEAGLRCVDGNLPLSDIEESRVRTFLLNACGSYREGRSLIGKGSVAGAVTLNPVLDDQAAKVGIAFARLLLCGFCIERALRIARRRAIMNKDYVVVGDGTYALRRHESPGVEIERRDSDRFELVFGDGDDPLSVIVTRSELLEFLRCADAPVVYDGGSRPPEDVYERLVDGQCGG